MAMTLLVGAGRDAMHWPWCSVAPGGHDIIGLQRQAVSGSLPQPPELVEVGGTLHCPERLLPQAMTIPLLTAKTRRDMPRRAMAVTLVRLLERSSAVAGFNPHAHNGAAGV